MGKNKKKMVALLLASLTGFSSMSVASSVIVYDKIFSRYERPDYSLVLGEYCYERVQERLPRSTFKFPSKEKGVNLQGYYYPSSQNNGLVVVAHGLHAGADDYLPIIEYMVDSGYNVFTYDVTGTYDSEGEGTVGMCQSLVDIDYALKYIKSQDSLKDMPLYLIGHSWGGYAVSSVLAIHKDIKGCACIAPMNNGYTMILEKGEEYAGKLALMPKPIFNGYQKILFGNYTKYSGVQGINSTNAHVIIAQGIDDKIITYNGQSITAHKDSITNPNVSYYIGKGFNGEHDNIWHSIASVAYQKEVASELKLLKMQKGSDLTDDEKREFYKTVNHNLYSQVNYPLMEQIVETFKKNK